jgi:Tat protein translocase TatB subunit
LSIVEIVVVFAVALVVLGPERFPDLLRTAGKIMRELRSASNEVIRELTEALDEQPRRPPPDRPANGSPPERRESTPPPPGPG